MRAESRKGSAIIEFAVILPILLTFLFAIIETGVIYFAQSTLQYATNEVARQIRTGQVQAASMTQAQFYTAVCNAIQELLACTNANASKLQIDVESYTDFSGVAITSPLDASGNLDPSLNNFAPGAACSVVLVRVFYKWQVMTPVLSWFLVNMSNNDHLLTAASSFRNEPFTSGISGC